MNELYELKEKLMDELRDYSKNGKFSKDDVESIKYITSSIDHICSICDQYEGNSMAGNRYGSGGRYSMAKRDSRGRYSRNYSYHGDIAEQLRDVMEDAPENVKGDIQRLINKVEGM